MGDYPDYVQAIYTSVKNTWQDAENLDDTHGYTSYIWIPEETFKVDVLKIHLYAEKFRAHSKSALAGGAQVKTSSSTTPTHTHNVTIGAETSSNEAAHKHIFALITDVEPEAVDGRVYLMDEAGEIIAHIPTKVLAIGYAYTYGAPTAHSHTINYGTKTSNSGGAAHTHTVTIDDHTHPIDFGIYEEDIAGRTLSAVLYDPDGNVLKDFGVLLTGEDSDILDLTEYFEPIKYGTYRLVLAASGRLRARIIYYELCKMYAQF